MFHHVGQPIGDFRKAWTTACRHAKNSGLLFHNLRRSAVGEMDRARVRQTVARKITGHKTPAMWRRYRITSVEEVRDALALTQTAIRAQRDQTSNLVTLRSVSEGGNA